MRVVVQLSRILATAVAVLCDGRGRSQEWLLERGALPLSANVLDFKRALDYLLRSAWLARKVVSASFVFLLMLACGQELVQSR
jgi:hypothetical protein